MFYYNDEETLVQSFTEQCSSLLDAVASAKIQLNTSEKSTPWIQWSYQLFYGKK